MWPSLGENSIVFENGGYLYVLDLATRQTAKLTITLPGERELAMKHWTGVANLITDLDIAPDGKRAVMTARGKIFTVPAKEGATRNLTREQGSREKEVAWSPDGRWIAYISDRSGEDEIYIAPQDGMGNIDLGRELSTDPKDKEKEAAAAKERGKDQEQQITSGSKGFMFAPRLVARRQEAGLGRQRPPPLVRRYRRQEARRNRSAAALRRSPTTPGRPTASGSPTTSRASAISARCISIHWRRNKSTAVTGELVNSLLPIWDPEGKYLYFLSDRDYNEVIGAFDFEFTNPKTTRVYLLTLRADLPSPFPALSDETEIKREPPAPVLGAHQTRRKPAAPAASPIPRPQRKTKPAPRRQTMPSRTSASISTAFRTASWRCPSPRPA